MKRETLIQELKKIEDNEGRLTPEGVVTKARNPRHPLHSEFEWNDSVAGEKYRIQQARSMIREVRINLIIDDQKIESIVYVRDPDRLAKEQGYRAVTKLANDRTAASAATIAEFQRALAYLKRARDVATSLGYGDSVDDLIQKVVRLSDEITIASEEATA